MERQKMAPVIGRCLDLLARGSTSTRRTMLRSVGALLGTGVVALSADPTSLDAKRKKKSKKGKKDQKLKLSDWDGHWRTRLNNGVTGTMLINYAKNPIVDISGTYVNSVGSGVFRCYEDVTGTDLGCRYDQDGGETGQFYIDLTDKDHWQGSWGIDGGESGTWSGKRI